MTEMLSNKETRNNFKINWESLEKEGKLEGKIKELIVGMGLDSEDISNMPSSEVGNLIQDLLSNTGLNIMEVEFHRTNNKTDKEIRISFISPVTKTGIEINI